MLNGICAILPPYIRKGQQKPIIYHSDVKIYGSVAVEISETLNIPDTFFRSRNITRYKSLCSQESIWKCWWRENSYEFEVSTASEMWIMVYLVVMPRSLLDCPLD